MLRQKLFLSVLAISMAVCCYGQKCKQFINYQAKTIDFKGLSVDVMGKATGKTDGFTSAPVYREASEEIQRLDMLQYNMCNQLKNAKTDYARDRIIEQQNNLLRQMMKLQEGGMQEDGSKQGAANASDFSEQKSSKPTSTSDFTFMDMGYPCEGAEFDSTDDVIRARAQGWSMDREMAVLEARTNALAKLVEQIEVTVNVTVDASSANTKINMTEDQRQALGRKIKTTTEQTISGWKVICEKTRFDEKKNRYEVFMAVEISVKRVIEGVYSKLREDAAIKNALPPQDTFVKDFNEIMGLLENSEKIMLD